jgi:hypothetical protein
MSKLFDMDLFLAGVLTGSHATRQRHLRQAKVIQAEIAKRWHRETPWAWQRKHVVWFIDHHLHHHSESTKYHYDLTVRLLARGMGKSWISFANHQPGRDHSAAACRYLCKYHDALLKTFY